MGNKLLTNVAEVVFQADDVYRELLLGCGRDRRKMLSPDGEKEWQNLTTLDVDLACNPDVRWDLNDLPLPFEDETFDEIHAYEVLEHVGVQGDYKTFFAQFTEFHRILKPGGHFLASTPCWDSKWAWGDPGHTRVINEGSLVFLTQENYETPNSPITDYRDIYKVDFSVEGVQEQNERFYFVLKKQ